MAICLENERLQKFIDFIKNGQNLGSYVLAKQTVLLFRDILNAIKSKNQCKTIREIMLNTQNIAKILIKAQSTETVIGNMAKRILKIIREEYFRQYNKENEIKDCESDGIESILSTKKENDLDFDVVKGFDLVMENIELGINELLSELDTSGGNIARQALEHIYWDEVILTIGRSKTVEAFLKYAAKNKRKFQVIIAECAPNNNGHELALSLAKDNIKTILIHDSAMFSVMSRVNKVIIGTHSIMANGGIKAVSGAYTLALAAKHYSVPFIVCTGMFKLTPQYLVSHDQSVFNKFASPEEIMNYKNCFSTKCELVNPVFDYVPPELITIFVSNIDGTTPSDVYRLLSEYYFNSKDELE